MSSSATCTRRQLGRHGHRDATMILLADRHGLRVSELVSLRREQLDLRQGLLHVRRRKNGLASTHPLRGHENSEPCAKDRAITRSSPGRLHLRAPRADDSGDVPQTARSRR